MIKLGKSSQGENSVRQMHHDNSFLRLEKTELIVGPDMDLVESPEVSLTKGSLD